MSAFELISLEAFQRKVGGLVGRGTAIVAQKEYNRIVELARRFQFVHNLADTTIQRIHHSRILLAGLSFETRQIFFRRFIGRMGSGKGHIQHKGLLALRNKLLCLRSQFIGEVTVERQFPPVVLVLLQVAILITGFRIIEIRTMAGQKPVERIEAFRIRTLGGFGAQMPFSDTARTVVIPFQQSRKQFFIVRKAISRLIQVTFISVALSVAARQHHGSRRAAHRRRHMGIRKDTPFGCQAVDVRCLDIRRPHKSKIRISGIIRKQDQDIRSLRLFILSGRARSQSGDCP